MIEKNRNRLKDAINGLPGYTPEDLKMWEVISARLNEDEKVHNLPNYQAPDGIWEGIENALKSSEMPLLPEMKAPEGLWDGVERELVKKKGLSRRMLWQIAAALVILLGLGIGLKLIIQPKDEVNGGSPTEVKQAAADTETEEEGIETIINPELCSHNPQICSSKEYNALQQQLEDVKTELKNMETILEENEDPQMLKYFYRLENEKMDIEKRLIKLVIES